MRRIGSGMNFDCGWQTTDTDVLVIGGGSAGCMTAIKAKDTNPDLDVTVIEKGSLRSSGAIAMGMDALNIVAIPGVSTPEDYVESMTIRCEGILDQHLCHKMAERSFETMKELESWGIKFPLDKNGEYEVFQVHPKGRFLVPMDAPHLKRVLAREVRSRGIEVIERTMATSLLTDNGEVVGCTGVNIRDGGFLVCSAKATVLTTGAAGRFGLPSTGYLFGTYEFPGNAGDGYSMAYRIGAELTGFEDTFVTFRIKDYNGPLWFITLPRGGQMINTFGDVLSTTDGNKGYHGVPIFKAWREVQEGRGPIYLRLSHLSEERLREIEAVLFGTERPTLGRFLEQRGLDLRKDLLEVEFSEPNICSGHGIAGIVTDEEARTSINGLYAAGDVSAVPFQHLTGAFVFGAISGINAARYASEGESPNIPKGFAMEEEKRVFKPLQRDEGLNPSECEYKIRRTINEYIAPPKTAAKLETALRRIDGFRRDVEMLKARDYHELGRALEIPCILDCAEMAARASLKRNESRWGMAHYRLDYPERDDNNWIKHLLIRKDLERGEMVLYTRPAEHKWRFNGIGIQYACKSKSREM